MTAIAKMVYASVSDVEYSPEGAIEWSAQMAEELEQHVGRLSVRSKYLKSQWLQNIENFKVRDLPPTLIAVCGNTGAGKSSLINAILEDSIVPTSAMRACTSVATQVSYHEKSTIAAEIEFISREDWAIELETCIHDLKDERGNLKSKYQRNDLGHAAGRAWQKIHTVYPELTAEDIITKTPDDIIDSRPELVDLFEAKKEFESANSTEFASEIVQYVDSTDRRKGAARSARSALQTDQTPVVLWPLIRVVRIAVKAEALKSGAVLVDLPGFGDSNIARSNVAHEFVRKCDYIWVVSKVQRAVDEEQAQSKLLFVQNAELNAYDQMLCFIVELQGDFFRTQIMMTQTDELDSGEIIRALDLSGDEEFLKTESELQAARAEVTEWDTVVKEADDEVKITMTQIQQLQSEITRHKARLSISSVKKEEPQEYHSSLSEDSTQVDTRKRRCSADSRSTKKARLGEGTCPDVQGKARDISMDLEDLQVRENVDTVVPCSWRAIVDDKESLLEILNRQLQHWRQASLDAKLKSSELQHTVTRLEKVQDKLCSKKRNEYVKDAARDDFQRGLRQLFDQSEALGANREPLNDFSLDLPVFTCSSRDFIRIKGVAQIERKPGCFTDLEDTEIPKLQRWCHALTAPSRQEFARSRLENMVFSMRTVGNLADKVDGDRITDRQKLSELWESDIRMNKVDDPLHLIQAEPSVPESARAARYRRRAAVKRGEIRENSLNDMAGEARQLLRADHHISRSVDQARKGVATQLRPKLNRVAADCVHQLQAAFQIIRDGCDSGVYEAATAAPDTSDGFAEVHYNTYQATLRRNGEWRDIDWNVELVLPLSHEIAGPWARVFHSNVELFGTTADTAKSHIRKTLDELVDSAPDSLQRQCRTQCRAVREEAEVAVHTTLRKLKAVLMMEQKSISRCLVPTAKAKLLHTYQLAYQQEGKDSFDRRKGVIDNYLEKRGEALFKACATTLCDKLDEAARSIGELLKVSFNNLSEKVEANVSILWDIPSEDKESIRHRLEMVKHSSSVLVQAEYWLEACKAWEATQSTESQRTTESS